MGQVARMIYISSLNLVRLNHKCHFVCGSDVFITRPHLIHELDIRTIDKIIFMIQMHTIHEPG